MLRAATIEDLSFIYTLFLQEAKARHFNYDIYKSFIKKFTFKLELKKIIRHGKRIYNNESASAFVFLKDGTPAGFTITSTDESNKLIEIWLVSIAEEHRGEGLGTQMTGLILASLAQHRYDIIARCHTHSERMIKILKNHGFIIDSRFCHPEIKLLILSNH